MSACYSCLCLILRQCNLSQQETFSCKPLKNTVQRLVCLVARARQTDTLFNILSFMNTITVFFSYHVMFVSLL